MVWEKNLSQLPNSTSTAPYPMNTAFPYDPRDGSVQVLYTDGSAAAPGRSVGALAGRRGLPADPRRPDGGRSGDRPDAVDADRHRARRHVFGDDEHVYVVGMGENGAASGRGCSAPTTA